MEKQVPARVYAKINLKALCHNLDAMRRCKAPKAQFCAVIKADGYGHGAVPIARRLSSMPDVWGFAVATVEEAVSLREQQIHKPILILGNVFPQDFPALIAHHIRPAVFTLSMARELSAAAARMGEQTLPIHLVVDTGMSRIGFPATREGAQDAALAAAQPHLQVEGLFTHFARADEANKQITEDAFRRYRAFVQMLSDLDVSVPLKHAANSAAILEFPKSHLNLVRCGITMYGIYPSQEMVQDKDLRPVMELKSRVSYVKSVPANTPVSYGGTFVTKGPTEIATIPVGYADGYPRSLSNRASVLIHGVRCPILGRVCMDQFMVDVTDAGVCVGDVVTLLGKDGGDEITVEELGERSGRFPYEFVCDIGKRVPRLFVDE